VFIEEMSRSEASSEGGAAVIGDVFRSARHARQIKRPFHYRGL
jgi:hypothetical protein